MPTPADPTRIHDLFARAVELPAADRPAFLDQACAADAPDVRAGVESLLSAHDRAGEFLLDPTLDTAQVVPPSLPEAGGRIGPYRLLRQLGEGGYGVVYLAEQGQPVRRRVALKVIKPGMDTRQVIARFEAERQALALMDHPNIAKVLDAGATEAGRPYFVMELVDGSTITDYCRARGLGTRQRLALFADVCRAVQHAHQKGVVHRDIKPTNVLVSESGGAPVPKVIDFGIAKALHAKLTDRTLFTEHRQLIGTPQYMSPEQAAGGLGPAGGVDVDTRTDVYSLGVLLYELLTGSTPFDPETLRSAAVGEIQRIIREVDPPAPSARLATLGRAPDRDGETAGASRDREGAVFGGPTDRPFTVAARSEIREVRGELDWIVMKCLEKDRARRYGTADALAADVGRFLADEPVSAGPPGRSYRVRKFARRHRGLLAAAGAVAAAVLVGLGLATAGFVQASHERDAARRAQAEEARQRQAADQQRAEAERQRTEAERQQTEAQLQRARAETNEARARAGEARAKAEADKVRAAQQFLFSLLGPVSIEDDMKVTLPPMPLLAYVSGEVGGDLMADHPEVAAPVRVALGKSYYEWKAFDRSEKEYRAAVSLVRRLYPGDDEPEVASSLNGLGLALMRQGRLDEAEPLFREALGIFERNGRSGRAERPGRPPNDFDIGQIKWNLAFVASGRHDPAAARPLFVEALASLRRHYGEAHPVVARQLAKAAEMLTKAGDPATAARYRDEAATVTAAVTAAGGRRQKAAAPPATGPAGSGEPITRPEEAAGRPTGARR